MLNLPVYAREGIYYFHTRVGGKQIKRSLATTNKTIAIIKASKIMEALMKIDLSGIRTYEIDLKNGLLKSDGIDDHKRMLEALGVLTALQQPISQPAAPFKEETSGKQSGLRMMAVLDKFFLLKSHLKQSTHISYKNVVGEFSQFLNNPQIQNIGVSDITRFQDYLAKNKNQARTIDNKIGTIRLLMNFAIKQGYYFDKNPAEKRNLLTKKQKMTGGYAIFEEPEIWKIYNSQFLKLAKINDPDYYWTLVLGLVTGCRISEITSLMADQFKISSGGNYYIQIRDSKTNAGLREIPYPDYLHKELSQFIGSKDQVFKYKLRLGKGSGNAVGKKFSRQLSELKIARPKLVFHSLRKFVNDMFLKHNVQFEPRCQFFGHEIDSVNVQTYSKKFSVDQLFKHVENPQNEIMKLAGIN
jgi:site-specific recombinase XerD